MLGLLAVTTMKGYRKVYKGKVFIIIMDTETYENYDGDDSDRAYDEEKDRIGIEIFEKIDEIYEEYQDHLFFRNDRDRLTKWVLQAVMSAHGSDKHKA